MADTKINELVINQMTKAQYDAAEKDPNQLYMVTDANPDYIGNLSSLQTTAKDNLVNAINEVKQGGGALPLLYETTLTEDVDNISISQDMEGNPLSLDIFKLAVIHPAGSGIVNKFVYVTTDAGDYIYVAIAVFSRATADATTVLLDASNHILLNMTGQNTNIQGGYVRRVMELEGKVTRVSTGNYSGGAIPAGVTIKLYGK